MRKFDLLMNDCLSDKRESYPLSPSQLGVYFACMHNPQGIMYNIPCSYRFDKSKIEIERLVSAIKSAVCNHDILKAYIDNSTGNPMIRLRKTVDVEIPVIKSDNLELSGKDFVKPFDLSNDLLFRFAVFESEDNDCMLVMDFHHIIFDGTSINVFCKDISRAYDGKELVPEQFSQLQVSVLEERIESTDEYTKSKEYYDRIFSGVDAKSEITEDFADNNDVVNKPSAEFSVLIEDRLSYKNVRAFADKLGVTPYTLMLGAYEYTVAKFTGQQEAVVCTVTHGRFNERLDDTVGMLVRTLPIYANINEEVSVSDFLTNVRKNINETVENDIYPFVKLASDYDISADIMFAYQSDIFNNFEIGGEKLKLKFLPLGSAIAKLNIMIFKTGNGFELRFEYRSDLYKEETIRSFADTYINVLEELMSKQKLCEIELVNDEQKVILDGFNKTEHDYDKSKTIVDLFREQAKKTPEKTAVVFKEKRLSYSQLDEITDRIAGYIHNKGIGKEDVVSVLISRSEYMPIASIGVLKSGAAYQPLDPSYPSERLSFMIEDASAKLLIADESLLGLLPEYKGNILLIKDIPNLPKSSAAIEPPTPNDLFILLYTSGSTGVPKGAMLEHKNIRAFCEAQKRKLNVDDKSVVSAYASYGFDACISDMYPALISGGVVHIISEELRLELDKLNEYFEKNGVTHAFMTTQVARQFAEEYDNSSLKYLATGGEKLVPIEPPKNYTLVNCYGPTECSVYITVQLVDKLYYRVPIGRPLDNVKLYVIDKYGRRLPTGALGELCVSGCQVSRGYLNRPEQTEKVFVKNPFTDDKEYERMYHTGDIVRLLSDGRIDFIGRNDGQVKIRGFRIELSEVEKIIRQYDGITDAAVIAKKFPTGGQYINAYIVADKEIDIKALNEFISQHKPSYMIPAATMQIDKIPLNVNGKVDKRKLPEIEVSDIMTDYVAPTNETEKLLCEAFEKILGCGRVGINDSFFDLGGDSIKVMKLQNKCSIKGLSTKLIFDGKTPAKIASLVSDNGEDLLSKCVLDKREMYPLTPVQMGIYLACVQNPTGTMYNIPTGIYIKKGTLDIDKLIKSIKKAVKNHMALNVCIDTSTGTPMMKHRGQFDFDIPIIKTDDLKKSQKEFITPFDIENDILFKFALFEIKDEYFLAMSFHHILFDGTSMSILANDIALAYEDKELPPEKVTQLDLSVYEEYIENTDEYKKAKEYYNNIFSGIEVKSNLTEDFAEKSDTTNPSEEFTINVGDALNPKKVTEFARKSNVTPSVLFLAAYEYAVAKFSGFDETVVCSVDHGRHDGRFGNTVGMMVHTMPFYQHIDEESSISDFLSAVRKNQDDNIQNEIYPFVKLASEYDISADVLLAYQSDAFTNLEIGGQNFRLEFMPLGNSIAKLNVLIFKNKDSFDIIFEYRSDLYKEETIHSFADTYINILKEFMTKQKLCEVQLVNDEQTAKLDDFNNTETQFDAEKTIVDLFREQVKKTPEKTAVVFKEKRLSYSQLDEITDRIAGYIHSKGIGKEDVVSVLIPRSEYMPIASIGVLKSGAAYQPLDPSYPSERLSFMIKDASAKLLIADESLIGLLPEYNGDTLFIKDIPSLSKSNTDIEAPTSDDLFTLIYTSGSTGVPKGTMLTHKNITAFCDWYKNSLELNENGVASAYASYGFDACISELYPALTCGAELHIIEEDIRLDLVKINNYYEDNGVTHAVMTTQVARQFATEIENHSLKYLLAGGERLVPLAPPANYKFVNAYGPTECTVGITSQVVDKLYDRIPIGYPIANTKLYVIDKYGRRLPIGALGELCAAGYQVSRGYLNQPEQTEKVFVKNPFTDDKEYERMYHTGDIVRLMPDGRFDFIGRSDGQVKIRGFRIELSEVEKIIRQYDGITDAAVVAKEFPTGGQYINAYIVADKEIDINKLNEFISQHKPPYMIPAAIMQIDKIPLNVNGKVDKRKLPEISAVASENEKPSQSARQLTFLEKKISGIVEEIIGHNEFDISQNLINVGMTSLSVIKLAVELNKAFGFEAKVKQMMKGCSILSIEDELQEFMLSGAASRTQEAPKEDEKKPHKSFYPLSKTQLGIYLDCMKDPYNVKYNIPSALKFKDSVDADKLARCVEQIIAAHPYLLTHFEFDNGDIAQTYVDKSDFKVSVLSLTETQFENFKRNFVKPHNLTKSPLFRINVVKTETNVYLVADFHHIIFDGASMSMLMSQLKTLYEGGSIEQEKYTYYDYIDDEIAAENGEEFKKAEKFFENMMKNFESATEITPDLRGKAEDGKLAMTSIPFNLDKVENFCSQNGFTPAHLFLAAVFYSASRFSNNRNVYLSTISNGRSDMRVTDCFGMFVKTLALGIEVEDISSIDFVKKSKDVFIDTIENEIYPYANICTKYGFSPNLVYEYQLGVVEELSLDGGEISREYIEMDTAKFKTSVQIIDEDGKPCVTIRYNDALYSEEFMHTFAQSIICAAEHIIDNPNGKIRNVSLLTDEQLSQLNKFATTLTGPVETKLLHKMFEKQVDKTPDNIALVACDKKLSYGELEHFANITANNLIEKGMKKGNKVVLLLERTSKFFTSLLGILKAGGAFIPTCPDYPKDRIDSIISDSEADFVITEGELINEYDNTVDVNELLSGNNDKRPEIDVKPEDLAYLIYTSGSTGKPKGVMLRHIGIANYLSYNDANIQVKYVVDNCKAYGSVTTISFDMSLKETLLSLCYGLTLVFASDEQTVNPISLAKLFKENNVDVFNSTPSRLLQYMELDSFAEAMANCKVILSGGEKYPDKLLNLLRKKTNAILVNTYGPTEITVSSNAKSLRDSDEITVGKPLFNYTEHIVDADNNLVPIGVVGELLISGCGVALGYNKLPEQTKKAFIEFNGERTYRSGDYAKWNNDGDVIILGRTDNQIKLRGLRIELGEIEKCLTNVNGVKSAIVLIRKVGNSDAICAYYTADSPLDVEFVKEELKKNLTDYMVPTAYLQLDEMPLTPNGKVNIKRLPEPVEGKAKVGAMPKTELEKTFCKIFADILDLDNVYADSSFFDIGGTSLTVTRVVIEASKNNINIAYSDVFANSTPQALASFVGDSDSTKQEQSQNLGDYDYSEIDKLLQNNNIDVFRNGERQQIGDVLLTGPSGFLGIHILYELIHKYSGKIYCMIRDKNDNPAESRLNAIYYYYFEESLKEKYPERVIVINGDVTNKASFEQFKTYKIDTVINCAANVKHFSKGTDIEDVNLYGTLNVVDFCKKIGARLVHVSTMSVGGLFVDEQGPVTKLKETQLYYGQRETSKYTMSKFLAERAILTEVSKGFSAKIMRVGTLSARNSDGEYQINFTTNTFMGRLKSNLLIGKYPYEAIDFPFELSPIDSVAKAILLLAQSPKECTVFHPFNNHTLLMGDLYAEMDRIGLHSKAVEYDEYEAALKEAEQDPEKAKILSSMIAYQNVAHGKKIYPVGKSNSYTMQVLYRMGFKWPVTSLDYMKRFINALRGLGFFG